MEKKQTLKRITVAVYALVCALFVLLSVYMAVFEKNEIYRIRRRSAYTTVTAYTQEDAEDPTAPAGVRHVYTFTLGEIDSEEPSLIFYVVHCAAEVRFDDELMYRLSVPQDARIGISTSSNWVAVPLRPEDSGRTVTVTLTPAYKNVSSRTTAFFIGSKYAVFMHQLKSDLPQIILSLLCITMGILLIAVQLYLIIRKRATLWNLFYLGNFSLLMGLWRITDTRFSPIMFGNHPRVLGYITLWALFLAAIPLLLFVGEQCTGKWAVALRAAALVTGCFALTAFLLQVCGAADLRELLTVSHGILVLDVLVLILATVFSVARHTIERNTVLLTALLVAGCFSDIVVFYIRGTSSGMIITLSAFLIYAAYCFVENIMNISRKANLDTNTKLLNKARWNELIRENVPPHEPVGIMMLDLNSLKKVNDTLGHKVGDRMIANFAGILRSVMDTREFLCRWGGDEFTVLVRNADEDKMEAYKQALRDATDAYNRAEEKAKIHYAMGYVLSKDFPTLTRQELLAKADEYMYIDKQEWHRKNDEKA